MPTTPPIANEFAIGSYIHLLSGDINGQSVQMGIHVAPGQHLSGSFTVDVQNNAGGNAVFLTEATPNWGNPATSYWQLNGPDQGVNTVTVGLDAPQEEGTYYIIVVGGWELGSGRVASGTNWDYGENVWGDGNDIAAWSQSQIDTALSSSLVLSPKLEKSGYFWHYYPATAVKVVVETNSEPTPTPTPGPTSTPYPTVTPTPEYPPTPPQPEIRMSVQLNRGWNLIPYLSGIVPQSSCGYIRQAWIYSPTERRFISANTGTLVPSSSQDEAAYSAAYGIFSSPSNAAAFGGMWAFSLRPCAVTYVLANQTSPSAPASAGWNFITVLPGQGGSTLQVLEGTCAASKAYLWDAQSQKWNVLANSATLNEGSVVAVKLAGSCQWGG